MLHPSYGELMEKVNKRNQKNSIDQIKSRYSIVIAVSKRARNIIGGEDQLIKHINNKPLSIAVEELNQGKIVLVPGKKEDINID